MRGTIRKIVNQEEYNFPATIDDPTSLDLIKSLRDKYILKKDSSKPAEEEKKTSASPKKDSPAKQSQEKKNGGRPVSKEFEGKTPEEIKAIKKERAAKRKKAFEERYEPRQLRPRNKKEEPQKPAKQASSSEKVG